MSTPHPSPVLGRLSVAAASLAVAAVVGVGIGVAPAAVAAPAPAAASSASDEAAASGSAPADGPSTRGSGYVGGGYWQYGVTNSTVYSKYQHASRQHSATACASQGRCLSSGWRAPGYLAVATRTKSTGGNTAFWNVR
ncbi:hypothetical protein ABID81_000925 [Frigoribacterium sp. PvP054]|uniref:lactococcin 972 family bacteriocin n=1 Tax=Frigoribacterium sp. PvP054 TaxID=3156438 RepID=UPI00339B58C6